MYSSHSIQDEFFLEGKELKSHVVYILHHIHVPSRAPLPKYPVIKLVCTVSQGNRTFISISISHSRLKLEDTQRKPHAHTTISNLKSVSHPPSPEKENWKCGSTKHILYTVPRHVYVCTVDVHTYSMYSTVMSRDLGSCVRACVCTVTSGCGSDVRSMLGVYCMLQTAGNRNGQPRIR